MILGNDIAGKLVVSAVVVEQPLVRSSIEGLEKENPKLFPACVVTRAMRLMETEELAENDSEGGGLRSAKGVLAPQNIEM